MGRATQEDLMKLENQIQNLREDLLHFAKETVARSDAAKKQSEKILDHIESSFQAYERMADKLIQMAMVVNGNANAASSHRSQARQEKESNSIPFRKTSDLDEFWDRDESDDDWAGDHDTMSMQ